MVQVEVPGAQEMQEVAVGALSPPQRTRPAAMRSARERDCTAEPGRAVPPAEWYPRPSGRSGPVQTWPV